MATRMQQRRGTAAQWISTNGGDGPVLNAGEIGFEIDNNRFKIGDGINHWVDLPYFSDNQSLTDLIDGAPDLLNTLGELADAIGEDPAFFTTVATNLSNHQSDTTNVHGIADTADLATEEYVLDQIASSTDSYPNLAGDGLAWNVIDETFEVNSDIARLDSPTFTGTVSGITKSMVGLGDVDNTSDADKPISTNAQAAIDLKADINSPAFTGTVTGVTKAMVGLGNANNTSDADKPLSTAAQTALNLKAPIAGPVFTGTTTTDNLIVDGDFTVNGTNFSASATSITIEDNLVQLAHTNAANTVDLGLVVSYNDGASTQHAGFVRDVSENTWKLFKNVESEPSTTVNFTEGELDDLHLAALQATSAVIGGVSNTEIQYLNGVTSSIQDQLDDKLESSTAATTYAPLASPTFTGTVSGVTKAHVGLGNVDNSSDLDKPISTLTQTALDTKASLSGATFTGPVAGITKSMVGLANAENTTDLNKPISTATQTALDAKLSSATASTTYAPIASPTFTGTVAGITKSMVGLANVANTADLDKPVSTDTQAALDLKAPLANPTFTGTVAGVSKSMVGLGNADNTADADKPVSTATQTALDAKAPIASPTFTGTVAGITKSMVGLGSVDNTSDANKPLSTAAQNALDLKAPLASPTFTGTVTFPTGTVTSAMILDGTIVAGDLADGAVTSGKILDGTIVNGDINESAAIDWTKLAISSTISATELGYLDGVNSSVQTQLTARLPLAGGTMTGDLTLSGAPTSSLHAATKAYVDSAVEGLHVHASVIAATTANVNLATALENGDLLDGVTLATGNRILVKNQTTQSENGIYVVQASGQPVRATDFDTAAEIDSGDFVFVTLGTVNANSGYVQTNRPAVIGTDAIAFTQFSGAGTFLAGSALTLTGNIFSIADGAITSAKIADATIVDGDISVSAAIAQSKIDGLSTSLGLKANLAGPTFTGTVTIPSGAALGTPASATLTNATGLPVATGIANLGTGVATFLTTPSSANLASMLTDEIGTGSVVLSEIATSAQTASYTLVAADRAKMVEMNVATANNVTVPPNSSVAYPVGTKIDILQVGAGQTTIVAGAGVTVNATPGLKLRAQWSSATLIKRAENTWVLVGDISA